MEVPFTFPITALYDGIGKSTADGTWIGYGASRCPRSPRRPRSGRFTGWTIVVSCILFFSLSRAGSLAAKISY
jgi:hypothetical protein